MPWAVRSPNMCWFRNRALHLKERDADMSIANVTRLRSFSSLADFPTPVIEGRPMMRPQGKPGAAPISTGKVAYPVRSLESHGVCEAFVKTFKRDYAAVPPPP